MATITKTLYVDAGCIWVGDPCYLRADKGQPCKVTRAMDNVAADNFPIISEPNRDDISERSDLSAEDKETFKGAAMFTGHGMGLCIDSGGDGAYTCTIKTNEQNRVETITINLGG